MTANRFNFRVWDKNNKCFSTGLLLTRKGILKEVDFEEGTITTVNQTNYELMQSTGLVDKNGKEIYEEDILKFISEGRIITFRIYFDKKRDCLCARALNDAIDCQIDKQFCSNKIVIGNTYENPELLEEIRRK